MSGGMPVSESTSSTVASSALSGVEVERRVRTWVRQLTLHGDQEQGEQKEQQEQQEQGPALAWLPPRPLLFVSTRLTADNRLPHSHTHHTNQFKPDQLLTPAQLDLHFHNITSDKRDEFHITIDENQLDLQRQTINDLKQSIQNIVQQKDLLQKYAQTGLELEYEFNKELELWNQINVDRQRELSEITEECEKLAEELVSEKTLLSNNTAEVTDNLIIDGTMFENRINTKQFEEYFKGNEYVYSYLKHYLAERYDEQKDKDSDDYFYNIDTAISTSRKMEDALWNYIKTKAELTEEQERFKFHLKYNKDNMISMDKKLNHHRDLDTLKSIDSEKDSFHTIRSFVDNQIESILYGELKSKTMKIRKLNDEFDVILEKTTSINNCQKILIYSLNYREVIKYKIAELLHCTVKDLILDAEIIQQRDTARKNISNVIVKSQLLDEMALFKNIIWKIFKLPHDISLSEALEIVNLQIDNVIRIDRLPIRNKFTECFQRYKKNKKKYENAEKFVYDGAAFYPNICNKETEILIYNLDKKNMEDAEKIKNATQKFMQLKTSLDLGVSTIDNL